VTTRLEIFVPGRNGTRADIDSLCVSALGV